MIDIKRYLRLFGESLVQALRTCPVELALALYAAVLGIVCYELDSATVRAAALMPKLALMPLFFLLALVVNRLAGRGPWRRIYWVVWTPLVPLSLWPGLGAWTESEQFFITVWLLAPLALLLCRRTASNDRFVNDCMLWLRSLLLAEFFAHVALGLFAAILYSTTYIFGLRGGWIDDTMAYAWILCEALAAPALFLTMAERWRDAVIVGNRILSVLLDCIVVPALLIYTAILYLYAAKILVTWSLPEGGVAYLVFGFTMTALAVKALQLVLEQRRYDWFFDRFCLVSLPLLVLFWVGVARRVSEYGLTEQRVWLLVCGGIMTLCVLLFLTPRTGRYRWVCAAAFGIFALLAYVPAWGPERVAVRSQFDRARRVAERLELLDGSGSLRLDRFGADTTLKADYRRFYEAAEYVSQHDTTAFKRFGATMEEMRKVVPHSIRDYVVYGWDSAGITVETVSDYFSLNRSSRQVAVEGYATLYPYWTRSWWTDTSDNCAFRFQKDTLTLRFGGRHPDWVVSQSELLAAQLRRAGIEEAVPDEKTLRDAADELLVYSDGERMIVFESMDFDRSDSTLCIADLSVRAVLTR